MLRSLRLIKGKAATGCGQAILLTSFLLIGLGGTAARAQTWVSAVSASPVANGAAITWSSAVPSDSQVEYGTTAAYGTLSLAAAPKVVGHSIQLTGLGAGTTYHFRVRSGDANGVLVVSQDYTLTLPAAPSLTASPATMDFGSIAPKQCSAIQLVTFTSSGNSSITLTGPGPSLSGTNIGDFAWGGVGTCHTGLVLAPGASCTHSFKFCPTTAGSRAATDNLPSNAGSPILVALTGIGSAAASSLAVSPANLSFSAQTGSSGPAPAGVSITNTGAGSLTFTGTSDQPWLLLSAASGTAPSTVQVSSSITGLKAGSYTGHVTLTGGGTTKVVTVGLTVTAVPTQHAVALSWKAGASSVTSYSMYRSIVSGSSYGLAASAINGATYVDDSVQPGTTYYYVVTAVDNQGRESAYSTQIKAVIP